MEFSRGIPRNSRKSPHPGNSSQGISGNFGEFPGNIREFRGIPGEFLGMLAEFRGNSQTIPGSRNSQGNVREFQGDFPEIFMEISGNSLGIREFPGIREPGNSPDPGISRECPGTFREIPWHSNGILGNFQGIYQGPGSGNSQRFSRGIPWHFQGIPRAF